MAHDHNWCTTLTKPTETGSDEWVLKSEADEVLNKKHSECEFIRVVGLITAILFGIFSIVIMFGGK